MEKKNKKIKQAFWEYSLNEKIKQSYYTSIVAISLILFFMIIDYFIMNRTTTFLAFGFPLFLSFFLIFLIKFAPNHKKITSVIYDILLSSLILAEFVLVLVYFRTDFFYSEVVSLFFVVFAVAFEINERTYRIVLINSIPLAIFILIFLSFSPTKFEIYDLLYILPLFIASFIGNRMQYKQKYRTFKLNYFLNIEKIKAEELHDESIKLNDNLKDAISVKDKFFSIISHDLRSPFNIILGFSEILHNDRQNLSEENITQYSKLINESAVHTFELLEDLLQWAKLQQGSIIYDPEIIFLNKLIDVELSKIKPIANKKHISISKKIDTAVNIYADTNMLRTILRNLLSNAIKFTNTDGHICISSTHKDNFTIISISDNGVGIPINIQKDIFDITVNTTSIGTENEKSSGLGLTLSKEFVEQHNGKIWFESEVGKGTIFFFSIPDRG